MIYIKFIIISRYFFQYVVVKSFLSHYSTTRILKNLPYNVKFIIINNVITFLFYFQLLSLFHQLVLFYVQLLKSFCCILHRTCYYLQVCFLICHCKLHVMSTFCHEDAVTVFSKFYIVITVFKVTINSLNFYFFQMNVIFIFFLPSFFLH